MALDVGVDTGGTHTDLVLIESASGAFLTLKVPTTPADLSQGILTGLKRVLALAGQEAEAVSRFVYGTTLVTNLIVEGRDLQVGLITSGGFRDVLEIGRACRKVNIYDIHWRPARPLVPRHLRLGVTERINYRGEIVIPLDEAQARAALGRLADQGVESIAVCFLNAYANPVHEERLAEIAAQVCPEVPLSLSSRVVREFREYERTSTTALNAFVMAPMIRHLGGLARNLEREKVRSRPYIMRGNGGCMSFDMARQLPAAVTHSGPVAGIVGGLAVARSSGLADVITFDVGGTSSDVAIVPGGQPVTTNRGKIGGHPVLLPIIDLVTIGAGGGSIAWIDAGGALKVGPQSAGSVPGPACYGAGGQDPTLTDANLVAGRLNPDYFLAGESRLRPELARRAIKDKVADPLGMTVEEAALGVLAIIEAHMVNAIKLVSVQRGLDPRRFALIGFGGAGPLHSVQLAQALDMDRVLIPAAPGNVSASGLLAAEIKHDLVRTRVEEISKLDPASLNQDFQEMLEAAARVLVEEGVPQAERQYLLALDLRYRGQAYELTLPLPGRDLDEAAVRGLAGRFESEHRRVYGYGLPDRAVEMVNLRVTGIGATPPLPWPASPPADGPAEPTGRRLVLYLDTAEEWPIYRFQNLAPGHGLAGPAIVEYPGSTSVVPPGWRADYDQWRNAHLTRLHSAEPREA